MLWSKEDNQQFANWIKGLVLDEMSKKECRDILLDMIVRIS